MIQTFETTLLARGPGGSWVFILMPFSVHKVFGSKARVPVHGTINGHPFRSSIIPEGDGTHYLAINKEMQQGAKAKAGDAVTIVIDRDEVPRTVTVPDDLAKAFSGDTAAAAAFERLAYSMRKEFTQWIEEAKRPETRARRVGQSLEMLVAGKHPRK